MTDVVASYQTRKDPYKPKLGKHLPVLVLYSIDDTNVTIACQEVVLVPVPNRPWQFSQITDYTGARRMAGEDVCCVVVM
jgi:hypothetical protein